MQENTGFYDIFILQAWAACLECKFSKINSLRSRNPDDMEHFLFLENIFPRKLFIIH